MALISKKNNAFSKVATVGGIDASTNPVTFAVTTGDGAKFPSSNFKISIDNEILLCTSRTGDSLTCSRNQESTSIAAHSQNADVEVRITAGTLEEYDAVLKAASQSSEADNVVLKEQASAPTTPSAGYGKIYRKTDGVVYKLGSDGIEVSMEATMLPDGWTPAGETLAYATAATITVASGAASKYKKGDKLKFTQHGSVKYFYIINVADTVLTVVGSTSAIVVEDTATYPITLPYYSHASTPVGFPAYFTWTPVLTGGASDLSGYDTAVYTIQGTELSFIFNAANRNVTGSAGLINVTLPVTPAVNLGDRFGYATMYPIAAAYAPIRTTVSGGSINLAKGMTSENFAGNETGIYLQIEGRYWI